MITWPQPQEYGYDPNGFKKRMQNIMVNQILQDNKHTQLRLNHWQQLLSKGIYTHTSLLLKTYIREGIPDSLRRQVWPLLIKGDVPSYDKICSQPFEDKISKIINLDLERTFPDNIFFVKSHSCYQSLKKVLNCLSLTFPQMGYCQGLNFIVATVLLRLPEKETFGLCFYMLKGLGHGRILVDLKRVRVDLFVLDRLIEKNFKQFWQHMKTYEVESIQYAVSWFITLYCGCLPFEYNLRVLDLYLSEGKKILFRVALAILKLKKHKAKSLCSTEQTLLFLKNFDDFNDIPASEFVREMFSISISKKEIESYELQFLENQGPDWKE